MPGDSPDRRRQPRSPLSATGALSETVDWESPSPSATPDALDPAECYPFLAPAEAPHELGRIGTYGILGLLGAGGMGLVFCAEDEALKRRVALKVLKPQLAADGRSRLRFVREAQAAASVEHDHVVAVYYVGEHEGVPYLVMPLLRGESLHSRLRRDRALPVEDIVRIGSEIADGLASAHAIGLVHRDIKPANVWLEAPQQRVKILDFGLARAVADSAPLTVSGTVIGTPWYMSPEQARGEQAGPRSDLFSLGCVLYQMCTGEVPFQGTDILSVLSALALHHPPAPERLAPSIPADCSALVMRLLAKDARVRPASARNVVDELAQIARRLSRAPPALALEPPSACSRSASLHTAPGQPVISVAVLPLANEAADPDADYLCDGISEGIIDVLSQLPAIRVLARSTVFRYQGRGADALELGRTLGVSAVMTGRLLKRSNRLIVRAELVDTADGARLWGCHFQRDLSDLLSVEETLSREIAENLRCRLSGEDEQRLSRRKTEDAVAYRLYLEGRYHWNKRTAEGLKKGIRLFEQAIDRDPSYALAYTGVADAWINLGGWCHVPCREAYPRAKAAALRALAIDDTLAEAHVSLAMVQKEYDWDWAGAESSYQRALQSNPGYAVAWQWYGEFLACVGRHAEAIAAMQRGIELDPLSLIIHATLGRHGYYLARDYDQATAQLQKTLEIDVGFWVAHHWLGLLYAVVGQIPEAIAEAETARRLDDGLETRAVLGYVYARAGRRSEAQRMLDSIRQLATDRYVSPMLVALVATGLEKYDEAFDSLERAWHDRSQMMSELGVEPAFDPLRADPRFHDLLSRVGLGGQAACPELQQRFRIAMHA